MTFVREHLPDPASYYEAEGLEFEQRRGAWRTTRCIFHDGSDSMRVNFDTGAFVCMAGCGAKGGDVLAYHMAAHGMGFVDACKALGAWQDDGKPVEPRRPTPLSARDALTLLKADAVLVAVAAGNVAYGIELTDDDRAAVGRAAARISLVCDCVGS